MLGVIHWPGEFVREPELRLKLCLSDGQTSIADAPLVLAPPGEESTLTSTDERGDRAGGLLARRPRPLWLLLFSRGAGCR